MILHERLGNWNRQLRLRLHDRPIRWFETRSRADLDGLLTGLACPVVLIDLDVTRRPGYGTSTTCSGGFRTRGCWCSTPRLTRRRPGWPVSWRQPMSVGLCTAPGRGQTCWPAGSTWRGAISSATAGRALRFRKQTPSPGPGWPSFWANKDVLALPARQNRTARSPRRKSTINLRRDTTIHMRTMNLATDLDTRGSARRAIQKRHDLICSARPTPRSRNAMCSTP